MRNPKSATIKAVDPDNPDGVTVNAVVIEEPSQTRMGQGTYSEDKMRGLGL